MTNQIRTYNLEGRYPNYDVSREGVVYKNGEAVKPFMSNGYAQVLLFDAEHKRKVCGVHTVVAMKYLDYYEGCVVHHIDGNRLNNHVGNLKVYSNSEHASLHAVGNKNCKGRVPWNKGMKMSEDFRRHCSEGAKRRHAKKQVEAV